MSDSKRTREVPTVIDQMDGRQAEARLFKIVFDDLVSHLGSTVSPYQRAIAEAAAALSVQLRKYHLQLVAGSFATENDARAFISASATLLRCLHQLNLPVREDIAAEQICAGALAFGDELGAGLAPEGQC
jgi:hypothetical protein